MERLADSAELIDRDVRRRGGILLATTQGIYVFPAHAVTPELRRRVYQFRDQLRFILSTRF